MYAIRAFHVKMNTIISFFIVVMVTAMLIMGVTTSPPESRETIAGTSVGFVTKQHSIGGDESMLQASGHALGDDFEYSVESLFGDGEGGGVDDGNHKTKHNDVTPPPLPSLPSPPKLTKGTTSSPTHAPTIVKRGKTSAGVLPEWCPCKQGEAKLRSVCWEFTDEKSGSCAKRACLPSYICIAKKDQHGITCMRRKTTSKIIPIGYYKCARKKVDGFMYVPYYTF